MVYSESHNFLYLRVPKNASTSLAAFFIETLCGGPKDKYTSIGDAKVSSKGISNSTIQKYREQYRFIHLTLQEIIDEGIVAESDLNNKKVITVIRNPLDRQLSLYFFLRRGKGSVSPQDFREQVRNGFYQGDKSNLILQSDYGVYNGTDYATHWPYERLDEYLQSFVRDLGYEGDIKLPNYKGNIKPKIDRDTLISKYYDEKTIKAVQEYYAKDIEIHRRLMGNEN